jgi:hypothetical protein
MNIKFDRIINELKQNIEVNTQRFTAEGEHAPPPPPEQQPAMVIEEQKQESMESEPVDQFVPPNAGGGAADQNSSKKKKKSLRINIGLVQDSYEDNPKYSSVTNLLSNSAPQARFPISRDTIFTPYSSKNAAAKGSASKNPQ